MPARCFPPQARMGWAVADALAQAERRRSMAGAKAPDEAWYGA